MKSRVCLRWPKPPPPQKKELGSQPNNSPHPSLGERRGWRVGGVPLLPLLPFQDLRGGTSRGVEARAARRQPSPFSGPWRSSTSSAAPKHSVRSTWRRWDTWRVAVSGGEPRTAAGVERDMEITHDQKCRNRNQEVGNEFGDFNKD